MPYYRTKSSSYRPPSNNVWQRAGETMSLNRACAAYGVTEEEVATAKLECQYRSTYGNSYAVVKVSDIVELKQRLQKEKDEAKEKALIEKHGVEGLAKMRRDAEEKKKADEEAAKAKKKRQEVVGKIKMQLELLLNFSPTCTPSGNLESLRIAKTAAKKEWFLNDDNLSKVESSKEGRSISYSLTDIIAASEAKHGSELLSKLKKRNDRKTLNQYGGYLQYHKLKAFESDLIAEARNQTAAALALQIDQSKEKIRKETMQMNQTEQRLGCLKRMFEQNDENALPNKKSTKTS